MAEFFKLLVPNVMQHMNHLNKKFSFALRTMCSRKMVDLVVLEW